MDLLSRKLICNVGSLSAIWVYEVVSLPERWALVIRNVVIECLRIICKMDSWRFECTVNYPHFATRFALAQCGHSSTAWHQASLVNFDTAPPWHCQYPAGASSSGISQFQQSATVTLPRSCWHREQLFSRPDIILFTLSIAPMC